MELLDFVEFFGKVRGERGGREGGKLLYLYRVKVSGGGGEPDSDH